MSIAPTDSQMQILDRLMVTFSPGETMTIPQFADLAHGDKRKNEWAKYHLEKLEVAGAVERMQPPPKAGQPWHWRITEIGIEAVMEAQLSAQGSEGLPADIT